METSQRRKNDRATSQRREMTDKTLSNNRDKNDELTQERRFETDKKLRESRNRNDGLTADRRELKDTNREGFFALSILVLIGILYFF